MSERRLAAIRAREIGPFSGRRRERRDDLRDTAEHRTVRAATGLTPLGSGGAAS